MNACRAALTTLLLLATASAAAAPPVVGVAALTSGESHLCLLLDSGAVYCRGSNDRGQLGSPPDTANLPDPPLRRVLDLPPVAQVVSARRYNVARTRDGEVYHWGDLSGWLPGQPTSPARRVEGVEGAVDVAASGSHGCALDADGRALCWGSNEHGQLGHGEVYSSTRALPVADAPAFVEIACADGFTWGRTASGQVWWWGAVGRSEPRREAPPRHRPRPLPGVDDAVRITLRPWLFCVRHRDRGLSCSQGLGAPAASNAPAAQGDFPVPLTAVPQGRDIVSADVKVAVCAAFEGRAPACRIDAQRFKQPELVPVPQVPPSRAVTVSGNQACALTDAGLVVCWQLYDRDYKPVKAVEPRHLTWPDPETPWPEPTVPGLQLELWSRLGTDLGSDLLQDHRIALTAQRVAPTFSARVAVEATLASPLSPLDGDAYPPLSRGVWLRDASLGYRPPWPWTVDHRIVALVGRLRPTAPHPTSLLSDRLWEGGLRVDGLAAEIATRGWRFSLLTGAVVTRDLEDVRGQGGVVALTAESLATTPSPPTLTWLYAGVRGDQRLHTLRAAAVWPFRSDLGAHLALSLQSGLARDQVVLAGMGEASLRWAPTASLPLSVELGWDHLTGDGAPDRGLATSFLSPFGMRHGRFGLLDLAWPARRAETGHGLEDLRLTLGYDGTGSFQARLEAHRLGLGRLPGGGPVLGHEFSGWARLALPGALALQLGGGAFLAEAAPEWRAWLLLTARPPVVL